MSSLFALSVLFSLEFVLLFELLFISFLVLELFYFRSMGAAICKWPPLCFPDWVEFLFSFSAIVLNKYHFLPNSFVERKLSLLAYNSFIVNNRVEHYQILFFLSHFEKPRPDVGMTKHLNLGSNCLQKAIGRRQNYPLACKEL